jgi:hypothetical protein
VEVEPGPEYAFSAEVWFWRGPSPFHFVTIPDSVCDELHELAPAVSYGWGMVPVRIRIGTSESTTSLFPKDGGYVLPIRNSVRAAEAIDVGDTVTVRLTVGR